MEFTPAVDMAFNQSIDPAGGYEYAYEMNEF